MARISEHSNITAFLDMIAVSEIGKELLAASDDGYNVIVGSTASNPNLFNGYADHPRKLIDLGNGLKSTAAGRYQILSRYYDAYRNQLSLPNFSPESQDLIAVQMIKECHAYGPLTNGLFEQAVNFCRSRWASLPGAGYSQHENKMKDLREAYENSGGVVA